MALSMLSSVPFKWTFHVICVLADYYSASFLHVDKCPSVHKEWYFLILVTSSSPWDHSSCVSLLLLPSTSSWDFYTDLMLVVHCSCYRHISDPVHRPSHGLPWLPEEWLPSFPLATPGKYLLLSIVIGSYLRFDSTSVCSGPKLVGSPQKAGLQMTLQLWNEINHHSQWWSALWYQHPFLQLQPGHVE